MSEKYLDSIVKHYENCLDRHGDSYLGVDWPKLEDVDKRYRVMLDVARFSGSMPPFASLLDFGCGAGHLLQYMQDHGIEKLQYEGLDVSEKFVALCKSKFPGTPFYQADILNEGAELPHFDYIVMNGVFTEKRELSFEEMWQYFCKMLIKTFAHVKIGLAFNVMSKAVDWERDDLFHMPVDLLIDFMTKQLSRNFIIRNDYGLYEFTTYIYK